MLNTLFYSLQPDEIPLTFSQQRIWILQTLYNDDVMYNNPRCFIVKGILDADAFFESLRVLIERHDALRFRLRIAKGRAPVQVIDRNPIIDIEQADLSHDLGSDKRERAWKIVRSAVVRPFCLDGGPMMRVLLVTLSRDEAIVLIVKHHLIIDNWAWGVFQNELMIVYSAKLHGREPSLPPLPRSYSDYARRQALSVTKEVLAGRREYWRDFFRDALVSETKAGPIPAKADHEDKLSYGVYVQNVPAQITEPCRVLAGRLQNTLFSIFLTGFSLLVSHLYRRSKTLLCVANANRREPGVDKIVGCFFTNVIFSVNVPAACKLSDLADNIRKDFIQARKAQEIPFEIFAEELALECTQKYKPPYPIYISYRPAGHDASFHLDQTQIETVKIPTGRYTHEDIALNIWESKSAEGLSWEIHWLWRKDLFDEQYIIKASAVLEALFCEIVKDDKAEALSLLAKVLKAQA